MDRKQEKKTVEKPRAGLEDYLYAILLFWGFLLVLGVVSFFVCGGVWDDVVKNVLKFLFLVAGGGFTLVSVLDYFYEKNLGLAGQRAGGENE